MLDRYDPAVMTVGPMTGGHEPIPAGDTGTPAHWSVTFGVDDADATAALATKLGAKVVVEPTDGPWVRSAVIEDPQGATFVASQFVPENKDLTA